MKEMRALTCGIAMKACGEEETTLLSMPLTLTAMLTQRTELGRFWWPMFLLVIHATLNQTEGLPNLLSVKLLKK